MNLKTVIFFGVVCAVIAGGVYTLFNKKTEDSVCEVTQTKPKVVCTTTFIGDLVRQIVDDKIEVITLMQPGIDPHTYKAQPHDVELLKKSDLVLYHGLGLEGKMAEVLAQLPNAYAVTDVLKVEDLLCVDEFFRIYDPHVWFDPRLWAYVAHGLLAPLVRAKNDCGEFFAQRVEGLAHDLHVLDANIRKIVEAIPAHKKVLVTAHDAFGYFGRAYGFIVRGLQGLSTEAEVGVRDVIDLAEFVVHHDVSTVFGETSVPRKALEALVQAVAARGKVVVLGPDLCSDSLGSSHDTATYQAMIESFAKTVAQYLLRGEQ